MATQHTRRIYLIVPVARVAALTTWWVANVDPGGAGTFTVGLNADGGAGAATHCHASGQFTEAEAALLLRRLANVAGVALPAWSTMTNQQRRQWVIDAMPSIQAATGIRFRVDDGDGAWGNPDAELAAMGVARRRPLSVEPMRER